MSEANVAGLPLGVDAAESTGRSSLGRRLLRNPIAFMSLSFLAALVLVAVFAPELAPFGADDVNVNEILVGPGHAGHWLGTDASGHDILSRLMIASRYSLAGAAVTVLVAAFLGISSGLLAGYFGGWFETGFSWWSGMMMSLPAIVVLLAARAAIGASMWSSMAIFGLLVAPAFYRVVYTSVSAIRNELYIDAARVFGISDGRIIARHVLRVVRGPAIVLGSIIAGIAITLQSGLDYLGLGDLSKPSWGGMLNDAFLHVYTNPVTLVWPSLAVALTCMALALLGNALRDELSGGGSGSRARTTSPDRETEKSSEMTATPEPTLVHETAEESQTPLLEITDLSVGYPSSNGDITTVVHDVSLSVRRGEIHGLVGESGSGKTQTAFSVLRLLPKSGRVLGGSIAFDGVDLATLPEREMSRIRGSRLAYVPQEPMSNLDPSFTIGSQLVEPMRLNLGISKNEARAQALDLLGRVGIADPARTFKAYPHEVSGGMAQRVLIAGAISCKPDLVIADEPTTALDVTVQADVLDLLRELQAELNMGVLLVTHNFGVVADLCDRVSVMRDGRIVETGPTQAIFATPRHPYTQGLLNSILSGTTPTPQSRQTNFDRQGEQG